MNIEQVYYGVLTLQQGNGDDYDFTLNGHSFVPSPVNDEQTIVKFEVNPTELSEVTAVSRTDEELKQTVRIGQGANPFTGVIEGESPEYVLASGPVDYFDYFLTNYDMDGNPRMNPGKSTFATGGGNGDADVAESVRMYSQRTLVGEDITIKVEDTDYAREWLSHIYKVQKDYGMSAEGRADLEFRVRNGSIEIVGTSRAIDGRNQKHDLVIKSQGYPDMRTTIETIRKAGDLVLNGDFQYLAGQDLLFELKEFNYAVTNPIYAVYLDGTLLEGGCVDYHVVSGMVRLENECHARLTPGSHELVIKADGFEDYIKTFVLETALPGQQNPVWGGDESQLETYSNERILSTADYGLDAVSSASINPGTGSGGSGSSSGGSSGLAIRGNIIFEFDLVANAKILAAVEMPTPESSEVISWWNSLGKDGAFCKDGQDKLVDYTYFKNHCGIQGSGYRTFQSVYSNPPSGAVYVNRPYDVKNMLEDGLLGETYRFMDATGIPAPALAADLVYEGQDIVIRYTPDERNRDWPDKIQGMTANGYAPVSPEDFTVSREDNTITVKVNAPLGNGEHTLTIYGDGYAPASVKVRITKENTGSYEIVRDKDGNVVISGLASEHASALTGVSLNGTSLFTDSQVGGRNGDYHLTENILTLRSKLFSQDSQDGLYTVILSASGFNDDILQFRLSQLEILDQTGAPAPEYVKLSPDQTCKPGEPVTISLDAGTSAISPYGEKMTAVLVNGIPVEGNHFTNWDKNEYEIPGSYFQQPGTYVITIQAEGYLDKVLSTEIRDAVLAEKEAPSYVGIDNNVYGHGVLDQAEIEAGQKVQINLSDWSDEAYLNAFTGMTLHHGDEDWAYHRDSLGIEGFMGKYFIWDSFEESGTYELTLHAEGYEDKVLVVTVPGNGDVEKEVPPCVGIDDTAYGNGIVDEISITEGGRVKILLSDYGEETYLNAFTGMTVEYEGDSTEIEAGDLAVSGFWSKGFTYSEFKAAGIYELTLHAEGYEDKLLIVTAEEKEKAKSPVEIPVAVQKPAEDTVIDSVPENAEAEAENGKDGTGNVKPDGGNSGSGDAENGSGTEDGGSGDTGNGSGNGENGSGSEGNGSGNGENGSESEGNGSGNEENGSGNKENGSGNEENGSGNEENGSGNEGNSSGSEGNGSENEWDGSGTGENGSGNEGNGSGSEGNGSGNEGDGSGNEGNGSGSEGGGSENEGNGSGNGGNSPESEGNGSGSEENSSGNEEAGYKRK